MIIGKRLQLTGAKLSELSQSADRGKARLIFMKAEELDQKFDDGEEALEHFDLSRVQVLDWKCRTLRLISPSGC